MLGTITMTALDTAFCVLTVIAKVPGIDSAGRTRNRVGTSNDSNHEITRGKSRISRSFKDFTERLMSEDQTVGSLWAPTVITADDIDICSTDS
jgi:hypothetical protein